MTTQGNQRAATAFVEEFRALRATAEKAIAQLDDDAIRRAPAPQTNSVAVIMKHVAGNFLSRFTDFLTTDGEKAWRNRDDEFVDAYPPGAPGRAAIMARWEQGWACVLGAAAALTDEDLGRTVQIRGEPHTVDRALTRALAHAGYHVGQIVLVAKMLVGQSAGPQSWKTISVPPGGSEAFNRSKGFRP
jgi:hypothetical protein